MHAEREIVTASRTASHLDLFGDHHGPVDDEVLVIPEAPDCESEHTGAEKEAAHRAHPGDGR
jgi:hypothetical protein